MFEQVVRILQHAYFWRSSDSRRGRERKHPSLNIDSFFCLNGMFFLFLFFPFFFWGQGVLATQPVAREAGARFLLPGRAEGRLEAGRRSRDGHVAESPSEPGGGPKRRTGQMRICPFFPGGSLSFSLNKCRLK